MQIIYTQNSDNFVKNQSTEKCSDLLCEWLNCSGSGLSSLAARACRFGRCRSRCRSPWLTRWVARSRSDCGGTRTGSSSSGGNCGGSINGWGSSCCRRWGRGRIGHVGWFGLKFLVEHLLENVSRYSHFNSKTFTSSSFVALCAFINVDWEISCRRSASSVFSKHYSCWSDENAISFNSRIFNQALLFNYPSKFI